MFLQELQSLADAGIAELGVSAQPTLLVDNGNLVGLMGSFAAMEAIRVITGFGDDPAGKLHIIDGLAPSMRTIRLPKDPGCSTCGAP